MTMSPSSCFMINSWQCPVPTLSTCVISVLSDPGSLSPSHGNILTSPDIWMHDQSFHVPRILQSLLCIAWVQCLHFVSKVVDILRHDAKSGYWPRSQVPSQVPTVTAHWASLLLVERLQAEMWLVETPSVQLRQLHRVRLRQLGRKLYCAPLQSMMLSWDWSCGSVRNLILISEVKPTTNYACQGFNPSHFMKMLFFCHLKWVKTCLHLLLQSVNNLNV